MLEKEALHLSIRRGHAGLIRSAGHAAGKDDAGLGLLEDGEAIFDDLAVGVIEARIDEAGFVAGRRRAAAGYVVEEILAFLAALRKTNVEVRKTGAFGGQRWWFVCPNDDRRVRKLYLPLGGRRFRSRRAYRLAYASQRETVHDRAMRRARKLCLRLGGDPADATYPPEKPSRMRWATYNRILDKFVAADRIVDERLLLLIAKLEKRGS